MDLVFFLTYLMSMGCEFGIPWHALCEKEYHLGRFPRLRGEGERERKMKTYAKYLMGLALLGLVGMGCASAADEIPVFAKNAFKIVDKNNDGLISPDEAKAAGAGFHVNLERFKAADTNDDRRLSLAECHAAKIWAPRDSDKIVVPPAAGTTVVVPPPPGRVIVDPPGPNNRVARDIREDARDRREDIADRREDIKDRREDVIDAMHNGGAADRAEDIRDRQEDVRDRNEDRRDRAEDRHDRTHGPAPRGHR